MLWRQTPVITWPEATCNIGGGHWFHSKTAASIHNQPYKRIKQTIRPETDVWRPFQCLPIYSKKNKQSLPTFYRFGHRTSRINVTQHSLLLLLEGPPLPSSGIFAYMSVLWSSPSLSNSSNRLKSIWSWSKPVEYHRVKKPEVTWPLKHAHLRWRLVKLDPHPPLCPW